MRRRLNFKKRVTGLVLLLAILTSFSLNSNVLCIETDGTAAIENAPLGSCLATEAINQNNSISYEPSHSNEDHEDCIDCTDISLSQTVSAKFQSELNFSITPDIVVANDISYEVPVYTEPILSLLPEQTYFDNQLHKHLQTIILLI